MRRLKIEAHDHGDGYFFGVKVTDAETGEAIQCVQSVELKMGMNQYPTAIITLLSPEVEVIVHDGVQTDLDDPESALVTWHTQESDTAEISLELDADDFARGGVVPASNTSSVIVGIGNSDDCLPRSAFEEMQKRVAERIAQARGGE